jgi:hypothetical protein
MKKSFLFVFFYNKSFRFIIKCEGNYSQEISQNQGQMYIYMCIARSEYHLLLFLIFISHENLNLFSYIRIEEDKLHTLIAMTTAEIAFLWIA